MHYAIASTHCELSGLDNFRLAIFLASAAVGSSTPPHYWRLQMPGRSQPQSPAEGPTRRNLGLGA